MPILMVFVKQESEMLTRWIQN